MKRSLLLIFFAFLSTFTIKSQSETEKITKEDYDRAVQFLSDNPDKFIYRKSVNPTWLNNENFWYQISTESGEEYVLVNAKTGKRSTAESLNNLLANSDLDNSTSEKKYSKTEMVSPNGKKVAYIKDWNLWMRNLETGEETQLTRDGIENYGYATDNAGWKQSDKAILLWSPDSKKIATYRQDQRHTSDMYLVTTNIGAPELQTVEIPSTRR